MEALLNVSFPVFGLIACGYLAARFGVLGHKSSEALNDFVYYFALPALLFVFVARAPLERLLYWQFFAAWGGGFLIVFGATALLARHYYRDALPEIALRAMNASFANTGYMGIPLVITAFGDAAALPAILATVFLSVVGISLTIVLLELGRRGPAHEGTLARDLLRALLKNPIIVPVAIGLVFPLSGVRLPVAIASFCDLLGSAAGPCALFALGLFISTQSLGTGMRGALVTTTLKLLVHPLVTWLLVTYVFELEPLWATVSVLVAALPMGATCFVLAQRYQVLPGTTSSATVLSTALSVVSVSVLLVAYGQ